MKEAMARSLKVDARKSQRSQRSVVAADFDQQQLGFFDV
jgi:hypothetical protein